MCTYILTSVFLYCYHCYWCTRIHLWLPLPKSYRTRSYQPNVTCLWRVTYRQLVGTMYRSEGAVLLVLFPHEKREGRIVSRNKFTKIVNGNLFRDTFSFRKKTGYFLIWLKCTRSWIKNCSVCMCILNFTDF